MVCEILFGDFENILKWEIAKIERFQCPDELCVMYARPEFEEEFPKLKEVIKEVLRNTDLITSVDENIFLILPNTNKEGAKFISEAIYNFFNKQVVEYYIDFPKDARTKDELIEKLLKDIENKYGILLGKYFNK